MLDFVRRWIIEFFGDGHCARQLAIFHRRRSKYFLQQAFRVEIDSRDGGPHRTFVANMADECPGIDVLDADDVVSFKIGIEAFPSTASLTRRGLASRTIKPSTQGRRDSTSSVLTP